MISISFPDGSVKQFEKGVTALQVAQSIGAGLAKAAVAAKIDGVVVDLRRPIIQDCSLSILTFKDDLGKEVFRHSSAHVLAIAVRRLFPQAKLTIGPAVEDGFYYDIDNETPFSAQDLEKLESEIKNIVSEDISFVRKEVSKDEAIHILQQSQTGNTYKLEMINELGDEQITIYDHGKLTSDGISFESEFSDLCRGPHVPSTGKIKAIKLMKVSGAFWRGDAKNKQLQRIYGVAFPSKDELKDYLKLLEEAQKRDHRKIGKDLDLFMFHEFSPGAPYFLPKGTVIYNQLVDFIRSEYAKRGYGEVITPQVYNKKLWELSGHWEHYKENMFIQEVDGQEASLKPMNCPSHCLIFKRDAKSYRDLPFRIADFCMIHRNEASGALGGLFRVRKFAQDDAHIFCTEEQVEEEVLGVLQFIKYVWEDVLGVSLKYYLSTKPEQALGTKEVWDTAEKQLASALTKANIKYEIKQGDGAFYGPKIDIDLTDALGRKWQCPTCQLDFNLPARFELEYEGSDNKKHTPVMIHRAVLGSLERFIGIIIEHYAGKFPLWLSPVQVKLLPIADRHINYCKEIGNKLKAANIRFEINEYAETINKKVRDAQLEQVNYILVIGDKEVEANTVNVRTRDNEIKGAIVVEDFISLLIKEVREKRR